LDVIGTKVLRVFVLAIHSHLYLRFYSPFPLEQKWLKLVCNVQTVYANRKSEKSQDYAQKPQRNCMFMNSASVKHAPKWTPLLSCSSLIFSEPLSDTRKRNVQPGQEFASLQNLIRGSVPSQPLRVNPVPSSQPLQVNPVPSQPLPVTPAPFSLTSTRSRGLIEPLFNTAGMGGRGKSSKVT
jgi:hypothetical protein